jgi:hypothetical protein
VCGGGGRAAARARAVLVLRLGGWVGPVWACEWWSFLQGCVMPPHHGAGCCGRGWVPGLGPAAGERGSPRTPSRPDALTRPGARDLGAAGVVDGRPYGPFSSAGLSLEARAVWPGKPTIARVLPLLP